MRNKELETEVAGNRGKAPCQSNDHNRFHAVCKGCRPLLEAFHKGESLLYRTDQKGRKACRGEADDNARRNIAGGEDLRTVFNDVARIEDAGHQSNKHREHRDHKVAHGEMIIFTERLTGIILNNGLIRRTKETTSLAGALFSKIHRTDILARSRDIISNNDCKDRIEVVGNVLPVIGPSIRRNANCRKFRSDQADVIRAVRAHRGARSHVAAKGVGDVSELHASHIERLGDGTHNSTENKVRLGINESKACCASGNFCTALALNMRSCPAGDGHACTGQFEHFYKALQNDNDEDRFKVADTGQVGIHKIPKKGDDCNKRIPSAKDRYTNEGADHKRHDCFFRVQRKADNNNCGDN